MCVRPGSVMDACKEKHEDLKSIVRRVSVVYNEHIISFSRVLQCHKRFRDYGVSLKDDARPPQVHRVITPAVIAEVDDLISGHSWTSFCIRRRRMCLGKQLVR